MFRFFITLLLGLAIAGGVAWYYDLIPPIPGPGESGSSDPQTTGSSGPLGDLLYAARPAPTSFPEKNPSGKPLADPIVVPGHFVPIDKQDIACQLPGKLLFVGERVPEGADAVAGLTIFMAPPFSSTRILRGGRELEVLYQRFFDMKEVKEGQMVAMLDFSKALNELVAKEAKILATKAELDATNAIVAQMKEKLDTMIRLARTGAGSKDELQSAELSYRKYSFDLIKQVEEVKLAKIEADQAAITLKQHEITNPIQGGVSIIKTIYKSGGAAVKDQEPIVHLFSLDPLSAEALVEVQFRQRLYEGMPVILEPTEDRPPIRVWKVHGGEVTSVAIGGKDPARPFLLSASEDRTVCVWHRDYPEPIRLLKHPHPVRVVACSPPGSKRNLALSGDSIGTIRLWDLDQKSSKALREIDAHNDAVTALAFSPDGQFFASGSADSSLSLWRAETGELVYAFTSEHGVDNPHQGSITALHFTPQTRLVSASRDNTLRIWKLFEKGPQLEGEPMMGRGGLVSYPGVSPDGQLLVFDQGNVLQFRSIDDGRPILKPLENSAGGVSFETLALFSPDGTLILTAGAAEGRLQLWRTPTATNRGFEVRQMVTLDRAPVTCAAFAPTIPQDKDKAPAFAVSGAKNGYVYLWAIPTPEEADQNRIHGARLTFVGQDTDASSRQIRIGVQVRNPTKRLHPGRPVTIVIEQ